MSKRLDLCVEKILARMIIDNDQRGKIEAELRDHLDELVAAARVRGLNEDDAEAEAIRQFGDSSALARAFNLPGGRFWVYFDSVILAGMLSFIWAMVPDPDHIPWSVKLFGAWLIFALLVLWRKLWAKIELNGGILIRPKFGRAHHIEFSQLTAVHTAKGHLFGTPDVVFEYEGRKVTLPATARGMRAACLAIETLVPGVFESNLMERMRKLRSRLAAETLMFQVAATVFWWVAIGFYLIGVRFLWAGEGLPWPSAIGLAIGFLLGLIQAWRLPNRARAAFLNLTAVALFAALMTTLGATFSGNPILIRQSAVITFMAMGFGLILTWWNGRRVTLLVICLIAACVFLGARGKVGPDYLKNQSIIGSTQTLSYSFTWMDRGQAAAWIDESSTATGSLLMVKRGDDYRKFPLEQGVRGFVPPRPGTRMQLLSLSTEEENPWTVMRMLGSNDRIDSVTLPYHILSFLRKDSYWSPDGRYFYFFARGNNDKTATSRLLDMNTRKVVDLNHELGMHVRWLDANRFRSCHIFETSVTNPTTNSILVYETDLTTGTSKRLHDFKLGPGEYPTILEGMHYALIFSELLDLETGQRIALPSTSRLNPNEINWDPIAERICYVADIVGQDSHGRNLGKALIVFHPRQGILARLDFDEPQVFGQIQLSPDGNRVLIRRSSRAGMLGDWNALTQTEIWDLKPARCHRLFTHGVICGILMAISESIEYGLMSPTWSPDGNEVAYSTICFETSITPRVYTTFILARP